MDYEAAKKYIEMSTMAMDMMIKNKLFKKDSDSPMEANFRNGVIKSATEDPCIAAALFNDNVFRSRLFSHVSDEQQQQGLYEIAKANAAKPEFAGNLMKDMQNEVMILLRQRNPTVSSTSAPAATTAPVETPKPVEVEAKGNTPGFNSMPGKGADETKWITARPSSQGHTWLAAKPSQVEKPATPEPPEQLGTLKK